MNIQELETNVEDLSRRSLHEWQTYTLRIIALEEKVEKLSEQVIELKNGGPQEWRKWRKKK